LVANNLAAVHIFEISAENRKMARLPKIVIESIALPIGNYEDIGLRALRLLGEASVIFCEDTRKVKSLLESRGIASKSKWISIPGDEEWNFDFSKFAAGASDGDIWAVVSDAGTPVLNDPGRAIIEWARNEGLRVGVVPGPSAVTAALQWSGGFGVPLVFLGFAPKEKNPKSVNWEKFFAVAESVATVIFFDTKHQVINTLDALLERGLSETPLYVAREISKEHEELLFGTVKSLRDIFAARLAKNEPIGELTLVMKGVVAAERKSVISLEALKSFRKASTKDAAKWAAEVTGLSKGDCYQAFLEDHE
jgi:16S rRNA (cytidine1402-2'-O)-methyltransferase